MFLQKNEMMTQLTEKNDQLAALSDLVKQLEQAQKKAISDLEVERTKVLASELLCCFCPFSYRNNSLLNYK